MGSKIFAPKPLEEETIIKAACETGSIVTAENNVIFGGLGSHGACPIFSSKGKIYAQA
jgi:transketolase C-terminal domain/subunit